MDLDRILKAFIDALNSKDTDQLTQAISQAEHAGAAGMSEDIQIAADYGIEVTIRDVLDSLTDDRLKAIEQTIRDQVTTTQ